MYDVLGWLLKICVFVVEKLSSLTGQDQAGKEYWRSSELGQQRQREREEMKEKREAK